MVVTPHSFDAPYRLFPACHPVLSSLVGLQVPLAIASTVSESNISSFLKAPLIEQRGSRGLDSRPMSAPHTALQR
jgi:hypothetical protein